MFRAARCMTYPLILALWMVDHAAAQSPEDGIGSTVKTIQAVVPRDRTILDSCSGDLNDDGSTDVVLVTQALDSQLIAIEWPDFIDTVLAQPRSVIVLFGSASGAFTVFTRNDNFIPLHDSPHMDEPLGGLRIENGRLVVHCTSWASMGSWSMGSWSYSFRFLDGELRLAEASTGWFHRASHESTDHKFNLLTGTYVSIENQYVEEETELEKAERENDERPEEEVKTTRSTGTLDPILSMTLGSMHRQGTWAILPDVHL